MGNTAEEYVAVKETISRSKRIILITSAFHMYRAKKLFEKQGFFVIPYIVDIKQIRIKLSDLLTFFQVQII